MQSQTPESMTGPDQPAAYGAATELPSRVRPGGTAHDDAAKRRRLVIFGGVGVVAVVLVVAGLFFFLGGSKSAEDTVTDYVTALQSGDAAAAYETFSTSSKAKQSPTQFTETLKSVLAQSGGIKTVTVDKVVETGSSAVAQYRVTTGLGEETWQVAMVKENGNWVIDVDQLRQLSNTYAN